MNAQDVPSNCLPKDAIRESDLFRRACDALELLDSVAPDSPRTVKLRRAIEGIEGGAA